VTSSDPKPATPPPARTDDVSAFVDMLAVQLRPALLEMARTLLSKPDPGCPCSCHTTPTADTLEAQP